MKVPANDAGNGGAAGEGSLPRDKGAADFIRNLRAAARNPQAAGRMSLALQRAATYDDRPRDTEREYFLARQVDRRLEPYLSELNRYAERRESREVRSCE